MILMEKRGKTQITERRGSMKNYFCLISILSVVLSVGCASTSEYNQLRVEFDNLKRDLNNQSAELYHDMSTFKDAYNPNLQDKFSENVSAAEEYRKSIERTKKDIEKTSAEIDGLLSEAENDRMLISENLKTSTAENIVNEFRQLNIEWDNTIFELSNLVAASERASASSHQAAMQAAEKAGAAERSADYASQSMNMIEEQRRSVNRIGDKIRNIEMEIRKLSKRLNEIDKPEGRHTSGKDPPEKQ